MAQKIYKTMIFLSASIPLPERHKKYFESADVIAIRDAVRALATVVIPHTMLVWGGHPAITPLIRYVMHTMNADVKEHVTLYQSEYFKSQFPEDNKYIENLRIIPSGKDRDNSLEIMRNEMIGNHNYKAGVFIGGMDGVEEEFKLFRKKHPTAQLIPVGSTGAAARIIYNDITPRPDPGLLNDYAYMALFRTLLKGILN
jgi:hypothetical protein